MCRLGPVLFEGTRDRSRQATRLQPLPNRARAALLRVPSRPTLVPSPRVPYHRRAVLLRPPRRTELRPVRATRRRVDSGCASLQASLSARDRTVPGLGGKHTGFAPAHRAPPRARPRSASRRTLRRYGRLDWHQRARGASRTSGRSFNRQSRRCAPELTNRCTCKAAKDRSAAKLSFAMFVR